jgi:hypothetical protein
MPCPVLQSVVQTSRRDCRKVSNLMLKARRRRASAFGSRKDGPRIGDPATINTAKEAMPRARSRSSSPSPRNLSGLCPCRSCRSDRIMARLAIRSCNSAATRPQKMIAQPNWEARLLPASCRLRAAAAYNANSRMPIAPIAKASDAAKYSTYIQSIPAIGKAWAWLPVSDRSASGGPDPRGLRAHGAGRAYLPEAPPSTSNALEGLQSGFFL